MPLSLSQLLGFLNEGMMDGFIGPDPLPFLATRTLAARVHPMTGGPFDQHPGSVLALRNDACDPDGHLAQALGRALDRALRVCADPAHWDEIARLVLNQPLYAGLGTEASDLASLPPDPTAISTRFVTGDFSPADAEFVGAACRAALGSAARPAELVRELDRVFGPVRMARTPAPAGR